MKFKIVNGKAYRKYLGTKGLTSSEVCRSAGLEKSYGSNATTSATNNGDNTKCKVNEVYWNLICDALNVPRDYFDAPEEEPKVVETAEEKPECLIDLADIQLSLNKIEALLLEQNKLLRGRLEKGERTNETKGATNSGDSHSYTVSRLRPTP